MVARTTPSLLVQSTHAVAPRRPAFHPRRASAAIARETPPLRGYEGAVARGRGCAVTLAAECAYYLARVLPSGRAAALQDLEQPV
jgi:hypothetical protein